MAEHRSATRRTEDRDSKNGWERYQELVLKELKDLKEDVKALDERGQRGLRDFRIEMEKRVNMIHLSPCAMVVETSRCLNEQAKEITEIRTRMSTHARYIIPLATIAGMFIGGLIEHFLIGG